MRFKLIVFDKGLELFHIGPLNTEETKQELMDEKDIDEKGWNVIMKGVKKGDMDLSIPHKAKFFSLIPEGPYLYGVDDILYGAAKYKTTQPIVVLDAENKIERLNLKEKDDLLNLFQEWHVIPNKNIKDIKNFTKCIDGWIGYDDYPEPWREIFLIHPQDVVSTGERYLLKGDTSNVKNYQNKELEKLHNLVLGCIDIEYNGGNIVILNEISHCNSLSLLKIEESYEKIQHIPISLKNLSPKKVEELKEKLKNCKNKL